MTHTSWKISKNVSILVPEKRRRRMARATAKQKWPEILQLFPVCQQQQQQPVQLCNGAS